MAKAATLTEIKRRKRVTLATLKKSETESFVVDRAHVAELCCTLPSTFFVVSYQMGISSRLKITQNIKK